MTDSTTHGVLVVGETGLGKTSIGRRVVEELSTSVRVLRIAGNSTLSNIPFAVLGPLLRDLPLDREATPLVVQRTILAFLGISAGDIHTKPRALFVVDDAHAMDDSSGELLVQLAASGAVKLLILSRPAPAPPQGFLSLWHDGMLSRHDLVCLNIDEIQELCVEVLGGEVTAAITTMMGEASGGNPMFLRHLLDQGRRLGHIIKRNGVWLLVGEPPSPGTDLTDLVRSHLRQRSPAELEALELIALAGPVAQSVLFSIADSDALDTLHADGLIRYGHDPEALVDIGHPLYAEVLRTRIPASRSRQLRERFLELVGPRTNSMDQLFRQVDWGLDCGARVEDDQLLKAAVMANRLYHPAFTLRAVAAIRSERYREAALVQQVRALIMQNNLGFARDVADELLATTQRVRIAKAAVVIGADIRLRAGDSAESVCVLADEWERALIRIRETAVQADMPIVDRGLSIGVRALRAYGFNLEGRFRETAGALEDMVRDPACSDELRVVVLALLCEAWASTGKAVQGVDAGREALQLIASHRGRFLDYSDFVVVRHGMALLMAGEWQELTAAVGEHVRSTQRGVIYLGGTADLLKGLIHLRQGRSGTALRYLRLAVEALGQSDVAQLLPLATGLAQYAAFFGGDEAAAQGYQRKLEALAGQGSHRNSLIVAACSAATGSLEHGVAAGIVALHGVAEAARELNIASVEAIALEMAFHLGDSKGLKRLAAVSGTAEGREATVINNVALAFLSEDPSRLAAVSRQSDDEGYVLLAAECLVEAAIILEGRGESRAAKALKPGIRELVARVDGTQVPRLIVHDTTTVLTAREHDIAQLARNGYSNRDIAERLNVSVRTVEGHLYRIFAKLGVARREDLSVG
ncbi:DNA-binding CsgD family transcriptional regulator [Arthrobacter roseus]|nr:LuxR family transcriptional regulator [Arthrobacter roseus]MBM7848031.1 DNA-binding CsgD family transcriptional regulator [Arthrobacter roseus]